MPNGNDIDYPILRPIKYLPTSHIWLDVIHYPLSIIINWIVIGIADRFLCGIIGRSAESLDPLPSNQNT